MSDNIRIKTTPGGGDKRLNVKIDQKFDFIEILSLKISQEEAYRKFCSDYGVVVGRVIVNNGLGVPNAKVSIFIPIDEEDSIDPEILGLYPYEVITDKDEDGIGYNLMSRSARGKDDCYTSIGTFPSKREIQDNPEMTEIYTKYYKFSTTTNESGDFMLFGVPVGTHYLHVDADISDIGILSQRPYDLISQGVDKNKFYSSNKFKGRTEDPNLTQLKTVSPVSVSVVPFWGDIDECEIGITRVDVDLKTTIIPTAIFMGSIFSDNEKNSVNKNCTPRKKLGNGDELDTGSGSIRMLRYKNDGSIENFDVEGGRVIDDNGVWAYQIPMNIDYVITSEDGTLIPSEDSTKGIATRARVRFKVDMDSTGGEGRLRTRASYLVPHNPDNYFDSDYSFDNTTRDKHFTDLFWNKIYTVKNHLTRVQGVTNVERRTFVGLKDVDEGGVNNPLPFNKMDTKTNPLFVVICIILNIIVTIICIINTILIPIINIIFTIINFILFIVCTVVHAVMKLVCGFLGIFSRRKKRKCREGACMGCSSNKGKICDCDQIVGLIPYIVLPCDEGRYAICGRSNGFPFAKTLEATEKKIALDNINENPYENNSTCNATVETDDDNFFYVGNSNCVDSSSVPLVDDVGFLNCILLQIAEALNVFKFDFYNDWINGTLYSFLLKYKKKKNNEGKYCNVDKGYSNYIVDSCTSVPPQDPSATTDRVDLRGGVDSSRNIRINEGYIKRFEGELFYAAYTRTSNYKLFATDIVSLGSILDCDWQGVPKIYPWLVETTYNAPPLQPEYIILGDGRRVIDISGYNSTDCGNNNSPLIGDITCFGLKTGPKQCNNIKRLSELGMGLDERRIEDGGLNVDNTISNTDIENPFIRGAFVFANRQSQIGGTTIPLTYIDSLSGGQYSYDYNDPTYSLFRNPNKKRIWQYEDSFYFYFGLNAGKTALNVMLNKFFTTCVPEVDNDFFVQVNNIIEDDNGPLPTGLIEIDVIGGIGPYSFQWTGPVVNGVQYPIVNNTQNISDLFVGTYNLIVVDSIGNLIKGSFIVPGPPSVFCEVQTSPTSSFGSSDGEIIVGIISGTPPYTIELYNAITNNLINTIPNITTQSYNITGLSSGNYRVLVKDNGTPETQCSTIVSITEPGALNIVVDGSSVGCFGSTNGRATVDISGGLPPYTILWSNGGNTTSINNLGPGNYSVTVTDIAGQSDNGSFTVTNPPQINYNITSKNITCLFTDDTEFEDGLGSEDGEITVNVLGGGSPPFTITLQGGSKTINQEINGVSAVFSNLAYGSSIFGGSYTAIISDSRNCKSLEDILIYRPEFKLGGSLAYNSNTLTATAIGGFAVTTDEDGNIIGNYTYRWETILSGGSNFTAVTTTTNNQYTPTTSGRWRAVIIDNNGTGGACEFITNERTV
jgi:hypothetical protein